MIKLGSPNQRFLLIEDTRELQCNAKNHVALKTTPQVNFQQLLRVALRSRPDKICMGECRGAEMLVLLKAWNTGTPGGIATVHANSAEAALVRVTEMIEEAGSLPQPRLVCESIQVIVAIAFHPEKGRLVQDVLQVTGFANGHYQFSSLSHPKQENI
jgi:type IV secretion system protein VirB11